MRALLTPEIAPRMGIVLFRPGSELMPLFMQGRVLLEPEPERYSSFASGAVPAASQPLADDPAVRAVFRNEAVIGSHGHTITVNAAGNAENTVKNIAFNYIVRLA
ncbi:hypothetical protein FOE36_11570 [Escherichia coli]|nr:hypothetical protein [Escherichia coli]